MNRKSKLLIYFAFIFLVACSQVEPPTITADIAIDRAYALLLQKGLESIDTMESSNFAFVQFPNGDSGAVVALGFSGPARGYRLLYRIRDNQLELVQLIERSGGVEWGLKSLQNSMKATAQVDIEFLQLLRDQNKQIIKMTGATHHGTGLWDDGYFEMLVIDNDGLKEIFSGVEYSTNTLTVETRNRYQFVDLDGDGNAEIIESSECWGYLPSWTSETREKLGFVRSRQIYRFNGARYVGQ